MISPDCRGHKCPECHWLYYHATQDVPCPADTCPWCLVHIVPELQALHRIGSRPKGYGPQIAAARARLKRKLRRAGVFPAWNTPTWGLAGLLRLPGVRARIETEESR